jgi:hypothetical protein
MKRFGSKAKPEVTESAIQTKISKQHYLENKKGRPFGTTFDLLGLRLKN